MCGFCNLKDYPSTAHAGTVQDAGLKGAEPSHNAGDASGLPRSAQCDLPKPTGPGCKEWSLAGSDLLDYVQGDMV